MRKPVALVLLALLSVTLIWRFGSLSGGANETALPRETLRAPAADSVEPDLALAEEEAQAGRELVEGREAPAAAEAPAVDDGAATGSLLLRAVSPDGAPVAGVTVFVTPNHGPRRGHGTTEHVTDEEGLARATGLPPGEMALFCPIGVSRWVDVLAGEEVEVVLEFERLLEVRGVVRGPDGRPVAGAHVWLLSWRRDWLGTTHAARCGPDGRFVVGRVAAEKSLGATAAGLGPSAPVDLELVDSTRSPVEIELTLTAEGGGLTGRVLDPDGAPVGGALVAVGESAQDPSMRHDGTVAETWGARAARTDAAGDFAFEGLPVGTSPLHAVAPDLPEYASEVEILPGESQHVDVQLVAGMSVRGVARDEDGGAISGAIVLALDAPFVDPFPTQGPTEPGAPFHRPSTRTDESGAFLLDRLPPGEVHLYASKGTSYWDDGDFVGTTQTTLTGAAGAVLEWNPVLSRGLLIRGRVLYADGEPMGNVFVSATDSDERRYTEHADEAGRFSIPGLENRAYVVSVQLWDPPEGAIPVDQGDVWPAVRELGLTANFTAVVLEQATARVRIDDRADRLTGKGGVMFAHDRGAYFSSEDDGVFSAQLPPGRYQAHVIDGDAVVGASEWFDLAPGEDRDLGTVVTRAAGSLVVRVRRTEALSEARVFASIQTDHAPRTGGREVRESGELEFEELLEGEVTVSLGGPGVAFESRRVMVQADSPTTVEFELAPAEKVAIEVSATPSAGFGKLEVSIRHEDGRLYNTLEYHEVWGARLPVVAGPYVPEGRYVVTATTTSGLSAAGELVVEAAEAGARLSLVLE